MRSGVSTEQVVVFKKGKEPFIAGLMGIAAERDFYSPPASDGASTLDDHITHYEERLAGLVSELRNKDVGSAVDAKVAAEIVGHLAPRSNHFRELFAHGLNQVTKSAVSSLSDADGLSRLLGFGTSEPNAKFMKMLREAAMSSPLRHNIESMELPERQVERMLVIGVREGFDALAGMVLPQFLDAMKLFAESVGGLVKHGHNKFLAEQIGGDGARADLKECVWTIDAAPPEGAVLPDCVAIGLQEDGFSPLLMVSRNELRAVVMPLTSTKLLVGRRAGGVDMELSALNRACAECSRDFFIGSDIDSFRAHLPFIGNRSDAEIEKAVARATEEFLPNAEGEPTAGDAAGSFGFQMSLRDFTLDEHELEALKQAVAMTIAELRHLVPTDALEGITFAVDYPAALHELDRGFDASRPITTSTEEGRYGVGQTPNIKRDGKMMSRAIIRAEFAFALVEEDQQRLEYALHLVADRLAGAGFTGLVNENFPDFLGSSFSDELQSCLFSEIYPAIADYFCARMSAGFGADEVYGFEGLDMARAELDRSRDRIMTAREQYQQDLDVSALFRTAIDAVGDLLSALARVAGHAHGLGDAAQLSSGALHEALQERGLRAWFDRFCLDLDALWRTRRSWKSPDVLIVEQRHVERVVWTFGIIPWLQDDGRIYVRVAQIPPVAAENAASSQ